VGEIVRCRFDHVRPDGSTSNELSAPIGQFEARTMAEVVEVLAAAETAAREGRHVAGFVSYEAAPAFDGALATQKADPEAETADLPLAWFGVFAEKQSVPSLPQRIIAPFRPDHRHDLGQEPRVRASWSCEIGPAEHRRDVEDIRSTIAAGGSYLVNLTTRFRRRWTADEDAFELYQRLVAGHDSGLHGFIDTSDWSVACGSPELFFELASGRLTTRPMKGTAARGRWGTEDLRNGERLRNSEKERAENLMVVDLLRNDLGRVATTGTVSVPDLWQVDRHPTVWQLTSTVTASVDPAMGLVDVFRALFPSGSVTGAPKVATMGVIKRLERSPRGVYCGAFGLIEPDPTSADRPRNIEARFSVAIRTAVVDKGAQLAEYGSGGGITWDSSAGPEWDEVMVKTSSLTRPDWDDWEHGFLFETMGFVPGSAGGVRNLAAHLARLAASAAYFGLPAPCGPEAAVARAVEDLSVPVRLRLVLHLGGRLEVDVTPMGEDPSGVQWLCLDHDPVDSSEVTLFHKTTDRRRYLERARRHPDVDDVVLVNERGEVTETTRANLCIELGGRWYTPPLDCGLLPGVERAMLLQNRQLAERVITIEELNRADGLATISSLRGWRTARMHSAPTD
jgi:para-aminobenzoate synthetase/4-amino-4-deoxychorismate lyase